MQFSHQFIQFDRTRIVLIEMHVAFEHAAHNQWDNNHNFTTYDHIQGDEWQKNERSNVGSYHLFVNFKRWCHLRDINTCVASVAHLAQSQMSGGCAFHLTQFETLKLIIQMEIGEKFASIVQVREFHRQNDYFWHCDPCGTLGIVFGLGESDNKWMDYLWRDGRLCKRAGSLSKNTFIWRLMTTNLR